MRGWALALLGLCAPASASFDSPFDAQVRVEARTYRYDVLEVRFPSSEPVLFPADATVWGHLYLPRRTPSARRPPQCVLVLPVMAAPNVWIEMRFINELLLNRFAVFWIEMPYQFHRRPLPSEPSGAVFLARAPGRLAKNFRQSLADARRALTWLQGSGFVDGDRIGIFGISLGALVGAAVYSLDARPRAAVLALGGADLPGLLFHSSMTAPFVKQAGLREEDLRAELKGLDPGEYRETNRGKRVLLINAAADTVIPRANGEKLKDAFPDARQLWVPFGHYAAMLHLSWMPSYVAGRFSELLR